MKHLLSRLGGLGLLGLFAFALFAPAQEATGKKYALLVGISQYKAENFGELRFTENDANRMDEVLRRAGYQVRVLTNTRGKQKDADLPTTANIRKELADLMAGKTRDDLILIGLAGHGAQISVHHPVTEKEKEYPFFCPMDADIHEKTIDYETGKAKKLIQVELEIYQALERCGAGTRIVLIDACRNELAAARSISQQIRLPESGVFSMHSCSRGQKAFETPALKHGIFFHYVIKGLEGGADNGRGKVTWNSLVDFVQPRVIEEAKKIGSGAKQTPQVRVTGTTAPILIALGAGAKKTIAASDTLYKEGLDHFFGRTGRVDEREALRLFRAASEKGNDLADAARAFLLFAGLGVERDAEQAGRLARASLPALKKAASEDGTAANWLGLIYERGIGVKTDFKEAALWFTKAAELGEADGMDNLGNLYRLGTGVPFDQKEAYGWHLKAAELGLPSGMLHVAFHNRDGTAPTKEGVNPRKEAFRRFKDAADTGYPLGITFLGRAHFNGPAWGTPLNEEEAVRLFEKAVEKGDAAGMVSLGNALLQGKGAARNTQRGLRLLRDSVKKGNREGMASLGMYLLHGLHAVSKDEREAIRLFNLAAALGNSNAMRELAVAYQKGLGVTKSLEQAAKWNQKAADYGNLDGISTLGDHYAQGAGVEPDKDKALELYEKAARRGHRHSMTRAGWMYMGRKTRADDQKALTWLKKAGDLGDAEAEFRVGQLYEEQRADAASKSESLREARRWYLRAAKKGHKAADKQLELLLKGT